MTIFVNTMPHPIPLSVERAKAPLLKALELLSGDLMACESRAYRVSEASLQPAEWLRLLTVDVTYDLGVKSSLIPDDFHKTIDEALATFEGKLVTLPFWRRRGLREELAHARKSYRIVSRLMATTFTPRHEALQRYCLFVGRGLVDYSRSTSTLTESLRECYGRALDARTRYFCAPSAGATAALKIALAELTLRYRGLHLNPAHEADLDALKDELDVFFLFDEAGVAV